MPTDEKKSKDIHPLSMPLVKNISTDTTTTGGKQSNIIDGDAKPPKQKSAAKEILNDTESPKTAQQKDFVKYILRKVELKVDEAIKAQEPPPKPKFPFILILVTIAIAPFLYNGGTDLYLMGKKQLQQNIKILLPAQMVPVSTEKAPTASKDTLLKILNKIATAQEKLSKDGIQKVVVLSPSEDYTFNYSFEKKKILEISGIDIDDPVIGSKAISKIKSSQVLIELIDTFNKIIMSGPQYNVSSFRIKNIIEAKKQALKKLKKLR